MPRRKKKPEPTPLTPPQQKITALNNLIQKIVENDSIYQTRMATLAKKEAAHISLAIALEILKVYGGITTEALAQEIGCIGVEMLRKVITRRTYLSDDSFNAVAQAVSIMLMTNELARIDPYQSIKAGTYPNG